MNTRQRRAAIRAAFELASNAGIVNALEWVENDMPLFYGEQAVLTEVWSPHNGAP